MLQLKYHRLLQNEADQMEVKSRAQEVPVEIAMYQKKTKKMKIPENLVQGSIICNSLIPFIALALFYFVYYLQKPISQFCSLKSL